MVYTKVIRRYLRDNYNYIYKLTVAGSYIVHWDSADKSGPIWLLYGCKNLGIYWKGRTEHDDNNSGPKKCRPMYA